MLSSYVHLLIIWADPWLRLTNILRVRSYKSPPISVITIISQTHRGVNADGVFGIRVRKILRVQHDRRGDSRIARHCVGTGVSDGPSQIRWIVLCLSLHRTPAGNPSGRFGYRSGEADTEPSLRLCHLTFRWLRTVLCLIKNTYSNAMHSITAVTIKTPA